MPTIAAVYPNMDPQFAHQSTPGARRGACSSNAHVGQRLRRRRTSIPTRLACCHVLPSPDEDHLTKIIWRLRPPCKTTLFSRKAHQPPNGRLRTRPHYQGGRAQAFATTNTIASTSMRTDSPCYSSTTTRRHAQNGTCDQACASAPTPGY